jgi:hypothetical protein
MEQQMDPRLADHLARRITREIGLGVWPRHVGTPMM